MTLNHNSPIQNLVKQPFTALDVLIEGIENGNATPEMFDAVPHPNHRGSIRLAGAWRAYFNESLDSAKSTHEALLPGWRWTIFHTGDPCVNVHPKSRLDKSYGYSKPIPAHAWLLAVLRAYRAISEEAANEIAG